MNDHGHAHEHAHAAREPVGSTEADFAECPVMKGTRVNKADAEDDGLVREHEGTRYYLCCESCAASFDANPAQYATSG